jgi:hypothetical protein
LYFTTPAALFTNNAVSSEHSANAMRAKSIADRSTSGGGLLHFRQDCAESLCSTIRTPVITGNSLYIWTILAQRIRTASVTSMGAASANLGKSLNTAARTGYGEPVIAPVDEIRTVLG